MPPTIFFAIDAIAAVDAGYADDYWRFFDAALLISPLPPAVCIA